MVKDIYYGCYDSKLGKIMIGITERGLCFLQFGNSEQALLSNLRSEFSGVELIKDNSKTDKHLSALLDYLRGQGKGLETPLDVRGTPFQIKVWNYLRKIPAGKVKSYTDVAIAIGQPKAVRAVASACARNNIAIAIPCHRIIRSDGGLAGYRFGLDRKRALLELEAANA